MKIRSLKVKAIIYTVLVTIVPLLIIGSIGTLYYRQVIEKNTQNDYLEDARGIATLTNNYMDRAVLYIEKQSMEKPLVDAIRESNTARLNSLVMGINESTPLYDWIFVTDTSGVIISSYPYSNASGKRITDGDYASEPVKTGKTYISGLTKSDVSDKPTIFIGTPIFDNGTIKGVLIGALNDEKYHDILSGIEADVPAQYVYVVNNTGRIIIHNNEEYMRSLKDFSPVPVVQKVIKGEEGVQEYDDPIEKGQWLGAYAPVQKYGWGVVVSLPLAAAYKPINDAMSIFFIVLSLLTLLSIGIALLVSRHIVNPLGDISKAVRHVGETRDISKYLPQEREDEMGELARSFDDMSKRIIATRDKILEERNRAELYVDIMGHDINNQNQAILSNLELLQAQDRLNDEQKKYLEGAIDATMGSAGIIKNVKIIQALSIEKPRFEDIDIAAVVAECIAESPRPENKKIVIDYERQKGKIVSCIPPLKVAFCNILDNSIRYSGPEVRIDIRIDEARADAGTAYIVTISDNGFGIPDAVKQKLFLRFQRDMGTLTGKGLGLYVSKRLIEKCGGKLSIENRIPEDYSKGTKIVIVLPAAIGGL